MGERRAFYTASDGCVAFADHPDLLLEAGCLRPVVDLNGLRELFALGPARTPGKTPWRDMYALEPGCALVARGTDARVRRYFRLEAREHEDDAAATVENVRCMLERAVDDIVPLRPASMLSGGIDSTVLTALLRKRMEPVRTFSVDYEGNARHFRGTSFQPERDAPYIELAVERIGCEHTAVELRQASLAQALEEAVDARGFPGMADVDSSLLLFARKIAPQARFVLSGECGDEVFGGYPWFRDAHSLNAEAFPWSGSLELRAGVLSGACVKSWTSAAMCAKRSPRPSPAWSICPTRAPTAAACAPCSTCALRFSWPICRSGRWRCASTAMWACSRPLRRTAGAVRLQRAVGNEVHGRAGKGALARGRGRAAAREPALPQKEPLPPRPATRDTPHRARHGAGYAGGKEKPAFAAVDARAVEKLAASDLSPTQAPWFGQLMAGPQMLAYLWQVNAWLRARRAEVAL